MDINSLIIAVAVIVTSAILLYMISLFTMKDKTFEEVMAEQKRQVEAEAMRQKMLKKADRENSVKKKIKKKVDKVKVEPGKPENSVQTSVNSDDHGNGVLKPKKSPATGKQKLPDKQMHVQKPEPVETKSGPKKSRNVETEIMVKESVQVATALPQEVKVSTENKARQQALRKADHIPVGAEDVKENVPPKSKVHSLPDNRKNGKIVVDRSIQQLVRQEKSENNSVLAKQPEKPVETHGKIESSKVQKSHQAVTDKSGKTDGQHRHDEPRQNLLAQNFPKSQPITEHTAKQLEKEDPNKVIKQVKEVKQAKKQPEGEKSVKAEKKKNQGVEPTPDVKPNEAILDKKKAKPTSNAKPVLQDKPSADSSKPKHDKPVVNLPPDCDVMSLVNFIKRSDLSESDVDVLINCLHSKEASENKFTSVKKKGDPMILLKNQLEEKDKMLFREQQMCVAANDRLKVMKAELEQEKVRCGQVEKTLVDKLNEQAQDVQALQSRMQHTHEGHMREVEVIRGQHDATVIKMREEIHQLTDSLNQAHVLAQANNVDSLKKQVQIMQTEMSNNAIKLNASDREKKAMQQEIDSKNNSDKVLSKRIDDLRKQMENEGKINEKLRTDLHSSTESVNTAQTECQNLRRNLKDLERTLHDINTTSHTTETQLKAADTAKSNLQKRVTELESELSDARKQCALSTSQIQELQCENNALCEELNTSHERRQGEGEEAPINPAGSSDKDNHTEQTTNAEIIDLIEHERILDDKSKEILQLKTELHHKSDALSDVNSQLEVQKTKNNELREKNWKAIAALKDAEAASQKSPDEAFNKIKSGHADEISKLKSTDRAAIMRIFPNISIDPHLEHGDWWNCIEHEANQYLNDLRVQSHQPVEINTGIQMKLKTIEEENYSLRAKVEGAEKILFVTECKASEYGKKLTESHGREEKATKKVAELERKIVDMEIRYAEVLGKRKELDETREIIKKLESEIKTKTEESEDLSDVVKGLRQDLGAAMTEIEQLKRNVSETNGKDENLEGSVAMKKALDEANSQVVRLKNEVKQKESFNSDLSVYKDELDEAKSEVARLEKKISEMTVKEEEFQKCKRQLEEAEEHISQLETQISDYRSVLSETEEKFRELEGNVNTEEQKWRQQISVYESELAKAREAMAELQRDSSDNASVTKTMEDKAGKLEVELQLSEENRLSVQAEFAQAQENISKLQKDLKDAELLSEESASLKSTIDNIKSQLAEEQSKSKSLATEVVKLKGIVKTGQDAVAFEQNLVKQLQQQKGTSCPSGENCTELRSKLQLLQSQLDREIHNNRNLHQKLTATTLGSDIGTSV